MKSFEKNKPWEEKKKKIIEELVEEGEEYKKESIQKSVCSICGKKIPAGEFYSKSIISGKITFSECDKGVKIIK
jgi:hypothetical protein